MMRIVRCRNCGGVHEVSEVLDGRPRGWYALSVNVPPEMGKARQPFLWVGVWCSTECLAADMPRIRDQEDLARMAYEPDPPVPQESDRGQKLISASRGLGR